VLKPIDPTKVGYDFIGWYTETDEKWVFAGYPVTEDVRLTARYANSSYTVALNPNGGSLINKEIAVQYDKEYELEIPTYEGHEFKGWYTYSNEKFENSGTWNLLENLNLRAIWDTFTIKLDSDGGTEYEDIVRDNFDEVNLPTPNKEGSTFLGWYLGDTNYNVTYKPNYYMNVTLKAHWALSNELFDYELIGEEAKIIKYKGDSEIVRFPEYIVNEGYNYLITDIDSNAFEGKENIKEIYFPSGLEKISNGLLTNCNKLETISIHKINYKLIDAFGGLKENVPKTFEKIIFERSFDNSNLSTFFIKFGSKRFDIIIGKNCYNPSFKGCNFIKSVIIKSDRVIYESFKDCSFLENVILDGDVSRIEDYAFYNCKSLKTVYLPDSVTSIGSYGFAFCSSLENILLPKNLLDLGNYSFNECTSLKHIKIPSLITKNSMWCLPAV